MITISITEVSLDGYLYSFELNCQHNNLEVMFNLYKIIKDTMIHIDATDPLTGHEILGRTNINYLLLIDKEAMYKITSYINNLVNELDIDITLNIETSKLRTIYKINLTH